MLASKMKILEPIQPKRKIRNRTVRGSQPCSVGVIEKKYHFSVAEREALKCNQREQFLRQAEKDELKEKTAKDRLRWENITYEKIFFNCVKTEINEHLKKEQFNLEARQDQLRQLLSQEEEEYFNFLEQIEETPYQRQEAMKERAKILKDKREEERLKLVQEKLDQQFRQQCGPFREAQSKQILKQICTERKQQIVMREEANRDQRVVDDMYANMWKEDGEKKIAFEEELVKQRLQSNKDLAAELRNQMAELDKNKEKENKLKEEELKIMLEQAGLQKLEEQRALQEKIKKQQERKAELDKSMKYISKRRAKMEQDELSFDIKMLENLMNDSQNEKQQQQQKKRECYEENQKYLNYLNKLLIEEKAREREMQRIIDEDIEKQWQKRLDKWRQEREFRRKLIDDVMKVRSQQLRDKLVENNRRQQEREQEKQEMLQKIEDHKCAQAEEVARYREKILQHRRDLQGQMNFNQRQVQNQKAIEAQEYRQDLQTEKELQQKINEVLSLPLTSESCLPVHPMRKVLSK